MSNAQIKHLDDRGPRTLATPGFTLNSWVDTPNVAPSLNCLTTQSKGSPMMTLEAFSTMTDEDLAKTSGGAQDFPGFTNCGPRLFSKGCVDGGMSLEEQLAISSGARMVNGKTATFGNWADWMRKNNYPSKALDQIGYPRRR